MLTDELVPELILAEPGEFECILPGAAEGNVEVWPGNDGYEAYGYAAGGYCWAHFPRVGTYRFLADQGSVVALFDATVPRNRIEDTYFRGALPLVVQLRGHEVLHASAVSTPSGLVVLCGASGTGKSTFSYELSRRGHTVWADDAVVLDLSNDAIGALKVPFRLGLRRGVKPFLETEPDVRSPAEATPERSSIAANLNLGRWDESELVRVTRLEPSQAFVALLPHAYYFRLSDPGRKALMLDRYMRLASVVPTFDVLYRPGLGHIAAVLDEIERHLPTA